MCLPIFKGKLETGSAPVSKSSSELCFEGLTTFTVTFELQFELRDYRFFQLPPSFSFSFWSLLVFALVPLHFPFKWLPSGPHIKADAPRELSPTLSPSVTQINAQILRVLSLECFRNPDKRMTQFHRRRGNGPCRSRCPADPRLQLAAMQDGLSIWFIGAQFAH